MTISKNSFENSSYIVVILLGFLQEAGNGISMVALQFLYKDEFHLDPSNASFMDSISTIPWIIKPVWGYISDSFYFFGYRRKSYLILFSMVQILSWCILLTFTTKVYVGIICLLLSSLSGAFINVICEALLVEITQSNSLEKGEEDRQTEASKNVSTYYGARYFGTLLTVFSGGVLLEKINKQLIFAISAIFSFLSGFAAFFLFEIKRKIDQNQEQKAKNTQNQNEENEDIAKLIDDKEKDALTQKNENDLRSSEELESAETEEKEKKSIDINKNAEASETNLSKLKKFFLQKTIFYPICFIFLLTVRPSSNQAIFFFYTSELGFQPDFIGILQLVHSLGSILGVYFYNRFCKFVSFRKFFICTTLIYVCLDLTQIILVKRINKAWGIPDQVFCIIDSLITDFMIELNLFPLLILSCRLSPKNIEGTMYALMMSIYNFSIMLGSQIGGLGMRILDISENDFSKLYVLIIFANIWVVSILPFIYFANFEEATKLAAEESKGVDNCAEQKNLCLEEKDLENNKEKYEIKT